jgi:hypothetical protein
MNLTVINQVINYCICFADFEIDELDFTNECSACSEPTGRLWRLSGNCFLHFQFINSLLCWQQSNAILLYYSPHRILVLIQHYVSFV